MSARLPQGKLSTSPLYNPLPIETSFTKLPYNSKRKLGMSILWSVSRKHWYLSQSYSHSLPPSSSFPLSCLYVLGLSLQGGLYSSSDTVWKCLPVDLLQSEPCPVSYDRVGFVEDITFEQKFLGPTAMTSKRIDPTPIGSPAGITVVPQVSSLSDSILEHQEDILAVFSPFLQHPVKKRRMSNGSEEQASFFHHEVPSSRRVKLNETISSYVLPPRMVQSRDEKVFNTKPQWQLDATADVLNADAVFHADMPWEDDVAQGLAAPFASNVEPARGTDHPTDFAAFVSNDSKNPERLEISSTRATLRQDHIRSRLEDLPARSDDASKQQQKQAPHRYYQSEVWYERYNELLEYKKTHGNCKVPHNWVGNIKLAQWVKRQRYQYKLMTKGKHSTLSLDRFSLLQGIGFAWDAHDSFWEEKYSELFKFHQTFGHSNVPPDTQIHSSLYSWTKKQRTQYRILHNSPSSRTAKSDDKSSTAGDATNANTKTSTLTKERIAKLDAINFVWDP